MNLFPALKLSQALCREAALAVAACVVLLLVVFGPPVAQHAHYHAFADQRTWFGLPFAMDVLSNLPFAIAGVIGLLAWFGARRLADGHLHPAQPDPSRNFAALFFAGLIVTALGSTYYHQNPGDGSLVVDRLGMVASFAGMLALAVAQRVSARAGWGMLAAVLVLGPVSVLVWSGTGNLLPWAVLQGGGLMLLLALAACRPVAQPPAAVALLPVVLIYTAAKLLELGDHLVFELTHHLVSGHSLKHMVAAFAAWPVICFMHNQKKAAAPKKRARAASRQVVGLTQSQKSF